MKAREDKRMVKLRFSSKLPFMDIYLKKSAHVLFGAWYTFGLHLVRDLKAL